LWRKLAISIDRYWIAQISLNGTPPPQQLAAQQRICLSQALSDDLGRNLREYFLNDGTLYIGQSKIAPLVAIGQLFVQQSKAVQNRSVEVVNVNLILNDVEAELIGLADDLASFDAPTRKPKAERKRMVISAFVPFLRVATLDQGCSPEFSGVDNQR